MLFKSLIAAILSNSISGAIIGFIFRERVPIKGIEIDTHNKQITSKTKSDIFWGIYESAEMRFVKKYVNSSLPIIELGGSIGVVTCYTGKFKGDNIQICVEANPNLVEIIQRNVQLNGVKNVKVLHGAVGDIHNTYSFFDFGASNILGKITEHSNTKVTNIKISTIFSDNAIENYGMICDIEGAEFFLFSQQANCFKNCKLLIIELHESIHNDIVYSVEDIKELIHKNTPLRYIENYGNVYVYKN